MNLDIKTYGMRISFAEIGLVSVEHSVQVSDTKAESDIEDLQFPIKSSFAHPGTRRKFPCLL